MSDDTFTIRTQEREEAREVSDDTFTILTTKGEFQARGVCISDMMLLMTLRWGGTLVCDKTGAVLFDARKDRPPEYANPDMKRIPAAVRHANEALAWDRWHALQDYGK